MTTISEDQSVFTVVARLTIEPDVKSQVTDLARRSLPTFQKQPGFISLSLHESTDGSETMTYLQWESQAHHKACMKSHDWAESNEQWKRILETGRAKLELQTYRVVTVVGRSSGQ